MLDYKPNKSDLRKIDTLVETYIKSKVNVSLFLTQFRSALTESPPLSSHIHSIKWRLKDPDHLRNKLLGKLIEFNNKRRTFDITPENLLTRVTDLAGVRILHLYTRQIAVIDRLLKNIIEEQQYILLEGPSARTWDDESREYFKKCGIETQESPSMYTSVHYVVGSNSKTRVTCEIQVRTLMEEVWGEVSHTINYPKENKNICCREQIKVLAKITSSATRLVDSIFITTEHHATAHGISKIAPRSLSTRTRVKKI